MLKRILTILLCAFAIIIYLMPNVALLFAVSTVVYAEYTRLLFILIMSWNMSKLVQYGYGLYRSRNTKNSTHNMHAEEFRHPKYSYSIEDNKITFTFKNIVDYDGRQLNRLKFIREKFFKVRKNEQQKMSDM